MEDEKIFNDNSHLCFVTTNNHKGGLLATHHLLGMGHRNIACIKSLIYFFGVLEVFAVLPALRALRLDS